MAQNETLTEDTPTRMISVYLMGKRYEVPEGLTIMKAMEYAGYTLIRGTGCRGGFCGACGTVYRTEGDYRLKVGLACQTVAEDGMYLAQIPFYPANRALHNIDELKPDLATLMRLYPELSRCVGCNSCTKACPQDLEVMDFMARAMRGDIAAVADMSFDCIMCGLCASRCPSEQAQYNVAILARRLYARHMAPTTQHLRERLDQMRSGEFDEEMEQMVGADEGQLREMYNSRDIEE